MKLISLGASSKGNSHIIYSNGVGIMLDCGVVFDNINEIMTKYNVKYILLSHKHNDHIKAIKQNKVSDLGQYIFANDDVMETISITKYINKVEVIEGKKYKLDDNFTIIPFEVPHDVKNFGFIIHDNYTNTNTAYITDVGYISNLSLKNINNFIVECNYDENVYLDKIEQEEEYFKYKRTLGDFGHISIQECSDFIRRNMDMNTINVILVHISHEADYKCIENAFKEHFVNANFNIKAINNRISSIEDIEITNLSNENNFSDITLDDIMLDDIGDFIFSWGRNTKKWIRIVN